MLKDYVVKVVEGKDLSKQEAAAAMDIIMSGQAEESQIAAFLTALKLKGEVSDEIAGFASTLIAHADPVAHKAPVMCNCGTGGDTKNTFNISTTVAFVLAGGGVNVAKHGNRSVSSASGSADVLSALGVNVDLPADRVREEIDAIGIGFLFAPALNKAMRFVAKTRKDLGFRTVFNLLGPIINPAHLDYQLVGVYDGALTHTIAEVLGEVGVHHALVIHSEDGMDEISTHTKTKVSELHEGQIRDFMLDPADYGFSAGSMEDYRGGTPKENARILKAVLSGQEQGGKREIVLFNAAAGFYVAGKTKTIAEGLKLAASVIDSGRAMEKLNALIAISNTEEAAAV